MKSSLLKLAVTLVVLITMATTQEGQAGAYPVATPYGYAPAPVILYSYPVVYTQPVTYVPSPLYPPTFVNPETHLIYYPVSYSTYTITSPLW